MQSMFLILNFLASLGSAAWGAVSVARPGLLSGSRRTDNGEQFYSRMYAARSVPVGVLTAVMPFFFGGTAVACLLFTAGAIQILDVAIALGKRELRMATGAFIAAMVHILCGLRIA